MLVRGAPTWEGCLPMAWAPCRPRPLHRCL